MAKCVRPAILTSRTVRGRSRPEALTDVVRRRKIHAGKGGSGKGVRARWRWGVYRRGRRRLPTGSSILGSLGLNSGRDAGDANDRPGVEAGDKDTGASVTM